MAAYVRDKVRDDAGAQWYHVVEIATGLLKRPVTLGLSRIAGTATDEPTSWLGTPPSAARR
jgi:hypothetical protein